MTESTATARRTERSPTSRRPPSDASHLSPHFACSVSVTTDPRPAVSRWEHFDLVTGLWWLYLLLFDSVSCFLLLILFFRFLFQPVLPSLPLSLCILSRHLSTCSSSTSLICCQEKLKLTRIRGSWKSGHRVLNLKSDRNKNPLLLASTVILKTFESIKS